MSVENFKISKVLFFVVFSLSFQSDILYGQDDSVNLIIVIDDEIVTKNLSLNFTSGENNLEVLYSVGKQLYLPQSFLNDKISLNFRYFAKFESDYNHKYNYSFDFKMGWLNNTNYLILRIYNLNQEKYKRQFCFSKENYVLEVQNSVYFHSLPRCK